jgi:acyl-CoA dehydrogenase
VAAGAGRLGLLAPTFDLQSLARVVDGLAYESSAAGMMLALHASTVPALAQGRFLDSLRTGSRVGALALSADEVPVEQDGRLSGRAAWIAPLTDAGVALVGARTASGEVATFAVPLDAPGVRVERLETAGLVGLVCANLTFDAVAGEAAGPSVPVMTRVRVLVAAAGLGIGRRALAEALAAAKQARTAAAGEQTVQGLLADAATELDAAGMLVWKASAEGRPSLGSASMAKLAAGAAAQSAVMRATQVIGAASFERGHIVERLARDVRALELFAGRTEALRDAVAAETLPH